MPTDEDVSLVKAVTTLNDVGFGAEVVDLSMVVDPGCRCIFPTANASARPTLLLDVFLQHRNVWPHRVVFSAPTEDGQPGEELWSAVLPRADPSVTGDWQRVEMPVLGHHNVWAVQPSSASGGGGSMPPWAGVVVTVERKSLTGTPSAADIPMIRLLQLVGGAHHPQEASVVYLRHGTRAAMPLHAAPGSNLLLTSTATAATDIPITGWATPSDILPPATLSALAAGECEDAVCGSVYLAVSMVRAAPEPSVAFVPPGVVTLVASNGDTVTVQVPDEEKRRVLTLPQGSMFTLWLPLLSSFVSASTPAFDWADLASLRIQLNSTLPDSVPVDEAAAMGSVNITAVRFGRPQRVGHVSSPDDYNVDDLACDPLTGWFDLGHFVRHDTVRYAHCRECCCFFDDPGHPENKHCYEQGDIISRVTPAPDMAPNDQCAVCNRDSNPQVMTPRLSLFPSGTAVPCDDGETCTWNDRCTDQGACVADLYTTCLRSDFHGGDTSKNCEVCDGTGPNSPTLGCRAAPGFYVHNPTSPNRTCACFIGGVVYPHLAKNPEYPCLRCDVTVSNTEWTEVPNDSKCDVTAQWDWENIAPQACTYKHICSDGVCGGLSYSCPPIQACEAPLDEFPHVCDLSGPASETGGCQRRKLDAGVVCAPQVHGCMPAAACTGIVGTCPPQISLPGIIYEDQTKGVRLRLPDGSNADSQYAVLPSLDDVTVAYDSFRVECGDLQLRMGIIPIGECLTSRVTAEVGNGWGKGFEPPPRGSFAVMSRPINVTYAPNTTSTTIPQVSRRVPGEEDSTILALDAGVDDFTPATVSSFRAAGVPEPFIDLEVMRLHGVQISQVELVDTQLRTVVFKLPLVHTTSVWTPVSGPGYEDEAVGFDWSDVMGVRLIRSGAATLPGVASGARVAAIRGVRVRTRAQGPPCAVVHLSSVDGDDTPLVSGLPQLQHGTVTYSAALPSVVDASSLYDAAQNRFMDGTVLTLEVWVPLPGYAPIEVAFFGDDGSGAVALATTHTTPLSMNPQDAVSDDLGVWARVTVQLRAGTLTRNVSGTTFQSATRVTATFDAGLIDAAAAAGVDASSVHLRRVALQRGAFCAHALETQTNGKLELFGETQMAPALSLEPQPGVASLRDQFTLSADIGGSEFDLDLSSLYDAGCQCFPDSFLEVVFTPPNDWVSLGRMDLVEASSGSGIRIDFDPATTRQHHEAIGIGLRRTRVTVDLDGPTVTVLGPPSAWGNVNVARFWHSRPAALASEVGMFQVHSMRVQRTDIPCVTSTTLLSSSFVAPEGAVATNDHEAVLRIGDEATGRLVRVSAADAGHGVNDTANGASCSLDSRQAGVWMDGGEGGDAWHAIQVTATTLPTPGSNRVDAAVAVLLGATTSVDTSARFAGVSLASASVDARAVVAARNARTGVGLWAVDLSTNATALGAVLNINTSATVLVLGSVSVDAPGATVTLGGATAPQPGQGGRDAFALFLSVAEGTPQQLVVLGSDGDEEWRCGASGHGLFGATHSAASMLVLGGSSTGRPAAMGLAADALVGATRVGFIVAHESVDRLAAGAGGVVWAMALGHATEPVDVSVEAVSVVASPPSVVDDPALVIAVGTYRGGALTVGDVTLPSQAGRSHVFAVALSLLDGSVLWVAAPDSDLATVAGTAALSVGSSLVFVAGAFHGSSTPAGGAVAALDLATGSQRWVTRVGNASCSGVALTMDGSGETLAVVGSTAAGGQAVGFSTSPNPVRPTPLSATTTGLSHGGPLMLHRGDATAAQRGLMAWLVAGTGAWIDSEVIPSPSSGSVQFHGVVPDALNDGDGVLVAGAAAGGAAFGTSLAASVFPPLAVASPATDAVAARFRTPHRRLRAGVTPVYREAGAGHELINSLVVLPTTMVVAGSAASASCGPVGGSGAEVGGVRVPSNENTTQVATMTVLARSGVSPSHQLLMGASWGITGNSTVSSVTALSPEAVVLVGYFDGCVSGKLSVPGFDMPTRVAHPSTVEPLVASVAVSTGAVNWVLPTAAAGATAGDDTLVTSGFDRYSGVFAAGGTTTADGVYSCEDWVLFPEPQGDTFVGCSNGLVVVADVPSSPTEQPEAVQVAYIGGHGLSAEVHSVSVGQGGFVAVVGDFWLASGPEAPAYSRGPLVVPGTLLPRAGAPRVDFTSGDAVHLDAPEWGATSSFIALFDGTTGDLVWAMLVGTQGATRGAPFSTSLRAAHMSHVGMFVCGHVTSSEGVVGAASAPVDNSISTRASVVALPAHNSSSSSSSSSPSSPPRQQTSAFVAGVDNAGGGFVWVQYLHADDGHAACSSLGHHGSSVVAGGSISPGTATATTSSQPASSLTAASAPDDDTRVVDTSSLTARSGAAWLVRVSIGGRVETVSVLGSRPMVSSGVTTASPCPDTAGLDCVSVLPTAFAQDASTGFAVAALATRGGQLLQVTADNSVLQSLAGGASRPTSVSAGTWDSVLLSLEAPTASDLPDVEPLPAAWGIGIHSQWGNDPGGSANVIAASATDTPSGCSLGFMTGVSVGQHATLSAGFFKGALAMGDADDTTLTSTGSVGEAGHGYDALALVYSVGGANVGGGLVLEATLTLGGAGGATVDDRFVAAAAFPGGSHHVLVGHAAVEVPATGVTLGGQTVVLPGGGGRDAFVALIQDKRAGEWSDVAAAVQWLAAPGSVSGGDNVLLDVDVLAPSITVAVGSVSGVLPTFGSSAIYPSAIESRTLATVYTLGSDGSGMWGRAFGTSENTGVAQALAVAATPSTEHIVVAGYYSGGSLQLDGVATLAPAIGTSRTAFVALLRAVDGDAVWVRAASTSTVGLPATPVAAAAYSLARSVVATPSSVVVVGEFNFPTSRPADAGAAVHFVASPRGATTTNDAGQRTLAGSPAAPPSDVVEAGTGPRPHAFITVLSLDSGNATLVTVPACPRGCHGDGVAHADGRAYVAVTYTGELQVGPHTAGGVLLSDPSAPAMHRAAVIALSGRGDAVDSVQAVGSVGGAHVDVSALAVRRGSGVTTLLVAGWRSGEVRLLQSDSITARGSLVAREVAAPSDAPHGALLEFQPMVAAFDIAARRPPPTSPSMTQSALTLALGTQGGGSAEPLAGVAPHGISATLTPTTSVVGFTVSKADVRSGAFGAPIVADLLAVTVAANDTRGVLVVTDRRSGADVFAHATPSVGARGGHGASGVAAVATQRRGFCASGWLNQGGGSGALPPLLGVDLGVDSLGGADAWVACFPDPASSSPSTTPVGTPSFVRVLGGPGAQVPAPGVMAVASGVVWVGVASTGPMHVAGLALGHGSADVASPPAKCLVATLNAASGEDMSALWFGGEGSADGCGFSALTTSSSGDTAFVAGWFEGASLQLRDDLTLTAPSAAKRTAFVMGVTTARGAGRGNASVVFASVAVFDPSVFTPVALAPITITGLALSERDMDGVATPDGRGVHLYVTGINHAADLAWSGAPSDVTLSAAANLNGVGDPAAAFVTCFDLNAAAGAANQLPALWTRHFVTTTRSGLAEVGGIAIAPAARLLLALAVTSPVVASESGVEVGPKVLPNAPPSQFGVVLVLHANAGAGAMGYMLNDPGPTEVSQLSRVTLAVAPPTDASAVATAADDIALVGLVRGSIVSSRQHAPGRGAMSPPGVNGGFALVSTGISAGPVSVEASVPLSNTDASHIERWDDSYVVQLEVWRSGGRGAITGGEWRAANAAGTGLRFVVSSAMQATQADAPRQWLVVDAVASAVSVGAGTSSFGSLGGQAALAGLTSLSLYSTPLAADDSATWRVRNVRVVSRRSACVPCGFVPVQASPVTLQRSPVPASKAPAAVGNMIALTPAAGSLPVPQLPVDASTLVDPSCDCLQGVRLEWEERLDTVSSPGLRVNVTGARLTVPGSNAGVFSQRIAYTPGSAIPDVNGFLWRAAHVTFALGDHVHMRNVDWRALSAVELLTTVPVHTDATGAVPGGLLHVRDMKLSRPCASADVLLHPKPVVVNTSIEVTRSELGLVRGAYGCLRCLSFACFV